MSGFNWGPYPPPKKDQPPSSASQPPANVQPNTRPQGSGLGLPEGCFLPSRYFNPPPPPAPTPAARPRPPGVTAGSARTHPYPRPAPGGPAAPTGPPPASSSGLGQGSNAATPAPAASARPGAANPKSHRSGLSVSFPKLGLGNTPGPQPTLGSTDGRPALATPRSLNFPKSTAAMNAAQGSNAAANLGQTQARGQTTTTVRQSHYTASQVKTSHSAGSASANFKGFNTSGAEASSSASTRHDTAAGQSSNPQTSFRAVDQSDLERAVVDNMTKKTANSNEAKLAMAEKRLKKLNAEVAHHQSLLDECAPAEHELRKRHERNLRGAQAYITKTEDNIKMLRDRIADSKKSPSQRQSHEKRSKFLIRTGQATPLDQISEESDDEFSGAVNQPRQEFIAPGFLPASQMLVEPTTTNNSASSSEGSKDHSSGNAKGSAGEATVDDDQILLEDSDDDEDEYEGEDTKNTRKNNQKKKTISIKSIDDGDKERYLQRFSTWKKERHAARIAAAKNTSGEFGDRDLEPFLPHPTIPDLVISEQFRIPGDIHQALFSYQITGVRWLWQLYERQVGGILSDEMGLGKTVQIISYIAAMHYSGLYKLPTLIIVPVTVLAQWVAEFNKWWPSLRVLILHSSGAGMKKSNKRSKDDIAKEIVNSVMENGHVCLASYGGLTAYGDAILNEEWGHVILDEGHQIRSPEATITLNCKRIKSKHRIILSGTPMQNKLPELWSMIDFVQPGYLGSLPSFINSFSRPIQDGTYKDASPLAIQTSYECALILKSQVEPYILRRIKVDVAAALPVKKEQVIFCSLTPEQRTIYENFMKTPEMQSIINGTDKTQTFWAIDKVRKICNHPDLLEIEKHRADKSYDYGQVHKSGKLQVLNSLLPFWRDEGHRTLVFAQTRQVLDVLEKLVLSIGIPYLRMDGETPVKNRPQLVDKFNASPEINVFLLTTKVGGMGINLTSANRVIIFDPHWNPSTDMQARERAWRLGQKKPVIIYRLLVAGTIEEKVYHRQIFKQFLSEKVLKDPRQNQHFVANDLRKLFSLTTSSIGTETGKLFQGVEQLVANPSPTSGHEYMGPEDPSKLRAINGIEAIADYDEGDNQADKIEGTLEAILSKSGVHSSLEHDIIMDSNHSAQKLIQEESEEVAKELVRRLEFARSVASNQAAGTLTWTGKVGKQHENSELSHLPPEENNPPYISFWPMYKLAVDEQIQHNIKNSVQITERPTIPPLPCHRGGTSGMDCPIAYHEKYNNRMRWGIAFIKFMERTKPAPNLSFTSWTIITESEREVLKEKPYHADHLYKLTQKEANSPPYELIAKMRRYIATQDGRISTQTWNDLYRDEAKRVSKKFKGFNDLMSLFIPSSSKKKQSFCLLWPDDPLRTLIGSEAEVTYLPADKGNSSAFMGQADTLLNNYPLVRIPPQAPKITEATKPLEKGKQPVRKRIYNEAEGSSNNKGSSNNGADGGSQPSKPIQGRQIANPTSRAVGFHPKSTAAQAHPKSKAAQAPPLLQGTADKPIELGDSDGEVEVIKVKRIRRGDQPKRPDAPIPPPDSVL